MPGDILYSREGERFGIAACVPDGRRLCISQRMMVFRVRPECNPARVVLTTDGETLVCTCLDRPTAERLARDRPPVRPSRTGSTRPTSACVRHCAGCSS